MKKCFVLALSFLLFTSQAFAASSMKEAVHEFLYVTKVEGVSTKDAIQTLEAQLAALKLDRSEMLQEYAQLLTKKEQKEAFLKVISSMQNLSEVEALNLMEQTLDGVGSDGASWTGDVSMIVGAAAIVLLLVVLSANAGPGCGDDAYYAEHQVTCDRLIDRADRYDSWIYTRDF